MARRPGQRKAVLDAPSPPSTMSVPSVPPPTYTREDELTGGSSNSAQSDADASRTTPDAFYPSEAQLLICAGSGAIFQFQKGYLGANGERAAMEGELQIKGVPLDEWERLTVSLRTSESIGDREVELNSADIELYSRAQPSSSTLSNTHTTASSIPFSIPLTADTPQCLHVGRSSLTHTLTASLVTAPGSSTPGLTRSVPVHTRRFSSHLDTCDISPKTYTLSTPSSVEVQVPRSVYRSNESIPIYVTIPPPDRSVILDHGFTLRNVRAELIRTVGILHDGSDGHSRTSSTMNLTREAVEIINDDEDDSDSSDTTYTSDAASVSSVGVPPSAEFLASRILQHSASSTFSPPYESIVARSGRACRFHTSRAIRLRLVLHTSFHHESASLFSALQNLPSSDAASFDENSDDANCASLTQTTVLHSISFAIHVRATFLHVTERTERSFPIIIPITLLPPPAPLPEVDPSIDVDYRKKHDRPPAKTVRQEEEDPGIESVHDDEGGAGAGPSAQPSGAPPPFDDAPPPFSLTMSPSAEASTSSRLPTFLESESEVVVPSSNMPPVVDDDNVLNIPGEGVLFGFPLADLYDGYSEEVYPSSSLGMRVGGRSPPPTLEDALNDDVANVQDMDDIAAVVAAGHRHGMEGLDMIYSRQHDRQVESNNLGAELPPPPPLMDDPSDPPPSIDSEFRSAHSSELQPNLDLDPPPSIHSEYHPASVSSVLSSHAHSPPPAVPRNGSNQGEPHDTALDPGSLAVSGMDHDEATLSPSHAPPPYLNPGAVGGAEHATSGGPPPYVDLVHDSHSN